MFDWPTNKDAEGPTFYFMLGVNYVWFNIKNIFNIPSNNCTGMLNQANSKSFSNSISNTFSLQMCIE